MFRTGVGKQKKGSFDNKKKLIVAGLKQKTGAGSGKRKDC